MGTPADILAIDNAADGDVKQVIREFGSRVKVISNPTNGFCNGGWNQILEYGLEHEYDIIGLGSSDVILHRGWYESLVARSTAATDEVWIPRIGTPTSGVEVAQNIAGFFTFLPLAAARLVCPIPRTVRHWFGDLYMFQTLRAAGWKTVVLNSISADHSWSAVTARTPEAYAVIAQDKIAWRALGYPWVD
jgi:hypothetical protein